MLVHARTKRYIVVLAPSTKWVKQKNWVLVSLLNQLLAGIFQQKAVTVV
jgi:hypothetical protein